MDSSSGSSFNRRVIILIVLVLGVVVIIGLFAVFYFFSNKDRVSIDVITVPDNASVTIDGQRSKRGSINVDPGQRTFKIEREGFESVESVEIVEEKDQKQSFVFLLTPASPEAFKWAEDNQQQYLDAEAISGDEAQRAGEELLEKSPIVEFLPYSGLYFRIDYAVPDKSKPDDIVIEVRGGDPRGRQLAIERIRLWGFEPTRFNIDFVDYKNQLGAKQ